MSPSSWSLPAVPCLSYEFAGALACHEHLRPQHGHDADDEDDPGQPSCSLGHQDRSHMGDDDARNGCYSAASFEDDYDYEQELDRWLEADPLSGFPDFRTDFRTCPAAGPLAAALSQHSADARLISEALSEPCCELSALLPPPTPLLSDADEHDPDCAPPRPCALASAASSPPGDGATAEDIARLLLCSAADAPAPTPAARPPCASFVPLTSVPVPPVVAAAAGDSSSGRGGSTCESASTSPRCRHSAFSQASSKLVQQPASQPVAPAAACSHKSGGPCDHCGATESPQWRRGPPAKPMLCNACGTRYRRTHQLGSYTGRGGKGGSLPGRKRRGTARVECRLHKQPKTSSLVVCAA